jgi:hypothetical protein
MKASDELFECIHPLLRYLISKEDISEAKIRAYCSEVENRWNTFHFEDKNIDDVIEYYNRFMKDDVITDPAFDNSELYLFIRYFIIICALDSYGRCEGTEELNTALERGSIALNLGLVSSLKRMDPLKKIHKAYGGTEEYLVNWMLNMESATWFKKMREENKNEITVKWHRILKEAFDKN